MKVLMMADVPPDPNSGAAGTEWQTARALARAGAQVETVWADSLPRRISHGNSHYLIELPLRYRRALRARFASGRYDVVHVNQPHGYLAAQELRAIAPRSVFVHRSHGFEGRVNEALAPWEAAHSPHLSPFKHGLSRLMQAALAFNNAMITRYAHGHIVSASECAAYLQCRHRVATERVAVIPQAAPVSFHEPPPALTAERRTRLLYVGQFAFVKAPFFVAAIAQRVLQARPDAQFTWVCDTRSHEAARRLFTDAAVLPRVTFLQWSGQDALRDCYDQHGIFVFPSLFEGFGKAFLEAMTRGLCVVAANNGGMHDVIRPGHSGMLATTGDCEGMAQACLELMDHSEKFLNMQLTARAVAENYTWDRVGRETLGFYEALLRLARPAGATAAASNPGL